MMAELNESAAQLLAAVRGVAAEMYRAGGHGLVSSVSVERVESIQKVITAHDAEHVGWRATSAGETLFVDRAEVLGIDDGVDGVVLFVKSLPPRLSRGVFSYSVTALVGPARN